MPCVIEIALKYPLIFLKSLKIDLEMRLQASF